jgi:hypothetical protein
MVLALGAGTVNAQTFNTWSANEYVDEFGDPTGTSYVSYIAEGQFSNSATTNSDCWFRFTIDSTYFIIDLYEYNNTAVSNHTTTSYTLKAKNEKGEIITLSVTGYKNTSGLTLHKETKADLLAFINKSVSMKMIINEDDSRTKYNTTVLSAGFKDVITL